MVPKDWDQMFNLLTGFSRSVWYTWMAKFDLPLQQPEQSRAGYTVSSGKRLIHHIEPDGKGGFSGANLHRFLLTFNNFGKSLRF